MPKGTSRSCRSAEDVARRALVTGIGGQDGSYLAELLGGLGYEVFGTVLTPPDELREGVELVQLELTDADAVAAAIRELQPDEIYHLASVSFVPASWGDPVGTSRFAAASAAALLEGLRRAKPNGRILNAASAEMFGVPRQTPQTEETPITPITPYGAGKAFALFLTGSFRRHYGLHASSAILFNHESTRRPEHFLSRKVSRGAAAIHLGLEQELRLGDLTAQRDWGFAGDYVRAMWLMLQADEPDDYVVATGEAHTVEDFVAAAFDHVGLDWRSHVRYDEAFARGASDPPLLVGDSTKIRRRLGWEPKVGFREIVGMLVDSDVELLKSRAAQGADL
jgi:GDPmannose 4,6-dehydratase